MFFRQTADEKTLPLLAPRFNLEHLFYDEP